MKLTIRFNFIINTINRVFKNTRNSFLFDLSIEFSFISILYPNIQIRVKYMKLCEIL